MTECAGGMRAQARALGRSSGKSWCPPHLRRSPDNGLTPSPGPCGHGIILCVARWNFYMLDPPLPQAEGPIVQ